MEFNHKNYTRLFEFGRIPISMSETFLVGYEDVEVCIMFDGQWSTVFMSKMIAEKVKLEAKGIYSSYESFKKLEEDFYDYRKRAEKRLEEIALSSTIKCNDYKDFFDLWAEIYNYYKKTEFFYVDEYFSGNLDDEKKKIYDELGVFKFEARKTLNEIAFDGRQWSVRVFETLSKQTGIITQDLNYMLKSEIEDVLSGKSVDLSDMDQRKSAYLGNNFNSEVSFVFGNQAIDRIKKFKEGMNRQELKGVVANKGYATGTARVMIFDMSKVHLISEMIARVNKGDILVTETTSPEWMTACNRASAIITAQGGLLSHAAIVSRELHIPCIVGVTDALKIIKDGDIIEVDADNGVIKFID